MHRLKLTENALARTLQAESRRSPDAAFLHRLHCVAMVAAGHGCEAVAAVFGGNARSVQRWVQRFREGGTEALAEKKRMGRPPRLGETELAALRELLANVPSRSGPPGQAWSAESLRLEIERRFGVAYSRRHCLRLLEALRSMSPVSPGST